MSGAIEIEGGIAKILKKGSAEPDVVRFHVPKPEGGWSQVTWGEVLARSRQVALWLDDVNGRLAPYETIKRYHLHDGHLPVEAGQVTPSLKVRRPQVWEAFRERFESLC